MTNPRVLIDGFPFENLSQSGLWRMCYETLSKPDVDISTALHLRSRAMRTIPNGTKVVSDSFRRTPRGVDALTRVSRVWSKLASRRPIDCEVYHSTYFELPKISGKLLVNFYDVIAETQFYNASWAERNIEQKRVALEKADLILCISKATAEAMTLFYPQTAGRVRVVHPGGDHLGPPKTPTKANRSPFVLFVGNRFAYKNFICVLNAMQHRRWPSGLSLKVAGPKFANTEVSLIRALGLSESIEHLGFVSDDELEVLYQKAACFVFPSLAEGFGIPILESQTNCCPVIASDIAVFREIAGDGASFFSPYDCEQLCECIASVLSTSKSEDLVEAGLVNINRFSWDQFRRSVFEIYRELASSAV